MHPKVADLSQRLRASVALLPEVRSDHASLVRWLRGARRAHRVAAVLLVVGLFVFPPVRDGFADAIFPPRGGGLFRRRPVTDPKAETLASVLSFLYWAGSAAAVGSLFLLELPATLGGVRRREDEEERGPGPLAPGPAGSVSPLPSGDAHAHAATMLSGGADAAPPLLPGAPSGDPGVGGQVGRYVLRRELGRGAMGVVYEGHDPSLDRTVALKQLPASFQQSEQMAARFRREAQALARLLHPGIVQVFDIVEGPVGMWIVMELVEGGSLMGLLEREGKLSVPHAARLGQRLAEALGYAHEQGIVHRDFKPDNVLLTREGDPKITDFGLAKISEGPKLTTAGMVLGSPAYMSPEQAAGDEADHRSDVYALGATLYELLAGRPPFEGQSTQSVLLKQITQTAEPVAAHVPDLPPELDALVQRMLAKDPADRPASMTEVARALAAFA